MKNKLFGILYIIFFIIYSAIFYFTMRYGLFDLDEIPANVFLLSLIPVHFIYFSLGILTIFFPKKYKLLSEFSNKEEPQYEHTEINADNKNIRKDYFLPFTSFLGFSAIFFLVSWAIFGMVCLLFIIPHDGGWATITVFGNMLVLTFVNILILLFIYFIIIPHKKKSSWLDFLSIKARQFLPIYFCITLIAIGLVAYDYSELIYFRERKEAISKAREIGYEEFSNFKINSTEGEFDEILLDIKGRIGSDAKVFNFNFATLESQYPIIKNKINEEYGPEKKRSMTVKNELLSKAKDKYDFFNLFKNCSDNVNFYGVDGDLYKSGVGSTYNFMYVFIEGKLKYKLSFLFNNTPTNLFDISYDESEKKLTYENNKYLVCDTYFEPALHGNRHYRASHGVIFDMYDYIAY